MSFAAMMTMQQAAESRRRRDEQGRYMDGNPMDNYRMERREQRQYSRMAERNYDDQPMDRNNPDGDSPYGGNPEVYRQQGNRRGEMSMAYNKVSGGEINYNRPDGGYGNVRYFTHKADPLNQREGKDHHEKARQIGFHRDDQDDEQGMDKQKAMEWVEAMEDGSGVKGGKYTWHQAQQYAMNNGITGQQRVIEFYAAMNAMYSDFHEAGRKFGVDKPEFYACLAKLFIEDPDAVDNKVEEYYKHIVRHDS